jgi:hypothetical protein
MGDMLGGDENGAGTNEKPKEEQTPTEEKKIEPRANVEASEG